MRRGSRDAGVGLKGARIACKWAEITPKLRLTHQERATLLNWDAADGKSAHVAR